MTKELNDIVNFNPTEIHLPPKMTKELQKRGFKSWKHFDKEAKEKDITIEFYSLFLKKLLKATNKKPHIEVGDSRDEYELWICDDSGKDIVVQMPELSHKLKELNEMIDNLPDNPHDI